MSAQIFEAAVCLGAIALQFAATLMVRPFRVLVSPWTWRVLILLNLCVLSRRILSFTDVVLNWEGQVYNVFVLVDGSSVSVLMFASVLFLRRDLFKQRQREIQAKADAVDLAAATLILAKQAKAEDSLALSLCGSMI